MVEIDLCILCTACEVVDLFSILPDKFEILCFECNLCRYWTVPSNSLDTPSPSQPSFLLQSLDPEVNHPQVNLWLRSHPSAPLF